MTTLDPAQVLADRVVAEMTLPGRSPEQARAQARHHLISAGEDIVSGQATNWLMGTGGGGGDTWRERARLAFAAAMLLGGDPSGSIQQAIDFLDGKPALL